MPVISPFIFMSISSFEIEKDYNTYKYLLIFIGHFVLDV